MSHFTVFVITDNPDQKTLETTLMPWHEYECTGYDNEYVVFVPHEDSNDVLEQEWKKYDAEHPNDTHQSLDAYMEDYYGYWKDSSGRYGRRTNPNAKWDWWRVGGRWPGRLRHVDGSRSDQLQRKDLDITTPQREAAAEFGARWDHVHAILKEHPTIPWPEYLKRRDEGTLSTDEARMLYNAQPAVKRINEIEYFKWDTAGEVTHAITLSREAYIYKAQLEAVVPWALVIDGEWMERGSMGWFGFSDDTGALDIREQMYQRILNLDPETWITSVDCHI